MGLRYKRVLFTCPIHKTKAVISYLDEGKGKPILFLHGIGLRGATYQKNIIQLSKRYRVIAPDISSYLPRKRRLRIFDPREAAAILEEFIHALKITDIAVIGHSYGGGAALTLAAISSHISRLVLVNTLGINLPYRMRKFYIYFLIKTIREITDLRHLNMFLVMCRHFLSNLFASHLRLPDTIRHTFKYTQLNEFDYSLIKIPTLILWGKRDEIFPPSNAHILLSKINNARLEIVEGNHDWLLFHPQVFYEKIMDFLLA